MLLTSAVSISSNIILLVRDNCHIIKGGLFRTFLDTVFFNSIDYLGHYRKNLVVIMKDKIY